MSAMVINSSESLQRACGDLRSLWDQHKFLRVNVKTGKDRSVDQNSLIHAWYSQLSRELREEDANGWKSFCKLVFGVPLLRAEDEEFRIAYDTVIKPLTYEKKLVAMSCWPVTSIMTKDQLSKYATAMQSHFFTRSVALEFPEEQ